MFIQIYYERYLKDRIMILAKEKLFSALVQTKSTNHSLPELMPGKMSLDSHLIADRGRVKVSVCVCSRPGINKTVCETRVLRWFKVLSMLWSRSKLLSSPIVSDGDFDKIVVSLFWIVCSAEGRTPSKTD